MGPFRGLPPRGESSKNPGPHKKIPDRLSLSLSIVVVKENGLSVFLRCSLKEIPPGNPIAFLSSSLVLRRAKVAWFAIS